MADANRGDFFRPERIPYALTDRPSMIGRIQADLAFKIRRLCSHTDAHVPGTQVCQ